MQNIRFYAYPPKEIDYQFILRNINQKRVHDSDHEIIDIGILDLLKTEDNHHSTKKLDKWKKTNLSNGDWKVVPDCPDIQREFEIESDINNIEYSKELIIDLFDPDDSSQIPVIQGLYHSPYSALEYAKWFKKEYPDYNSKFGLGTLCRSNIKVVVERSCRYIRSIYPDAWLHGFGLRLHHVPNVIGIIDSYDSSAWTFPRTSGRGSAKNKAERISFFHEYLDVLDSHINKKQVNQSLEVSQW